MSSFDKATLDLFGSFRGKLPRSSRVESNPSLESEHGTMVRTEAISSSVETRKATHLASSIDNPKLVKFDAESICIFSFV